LVGRACAQTVRRLLVEADFAPRVNVKRFTGPPHPHRDRQFRYLQEMIAAFHEARLPVISVDGKKKELIGSFKNPGAVWRRTPAEVNAHDFPQDAAGRGVPYGIYDLSRNQGYVTVGLSADTPEFATRSIAEWWRREGVRAYPDAGELLILADSGGSNGCRPRAWKQGLQHRLANAFGLHVTVCHYPRGASKWNPVEHRLFGPISINWSGEPLTSLQKMLALIRGTRTETGLTVSARADVRRYRQGVKVTNREMAELSLDSHSICPNWNYTISPQPGENTWLNETRK
jgi:hypothetical protein